MALASGVVADVATAAERGSYMGFATAGALLGPAFGPVVGGVLAEFLGWRAIFWFLVIIAGVYIAVFAIFFPETSRKAVGNGSIPPKGLNISLLNYLTIRKQRRLSADSIEKTESPESTLEAAPPQKHKFRFPNPLASIHIINDKETALLLLSNALLFAGFYDVTATIPSLYQQIYGFNDLQIGLCYIPFGFGSCFAALTTGKFLDWNFRRWARLTGLEIKKGRQSNLRDFPVEKARLQVALPCFYASIATLILYGWILQINGPLGSILVILFFMAYFMTASITIASTLLIDFYPTRPATATAANNLCRCLLGAGATAVIEPMLQAMGRGWCFTFISLVLLATSPILYSVYAKGMEWREERRIKEERSRQKKDAKKAGREEEGAVTGVKEGQLEEENKQVPQVALGNNVLVQKAKDEV